jgi:hypothetical protein
MTEDSPAQREEGLAEGDRQNGYEEELAQYESDLARYLQWVGKIQARCVKRHADETFSLSDECALVAQPASRPQCGFTDPGGAWGHGGGDRERGS